MAARQAPDVASRILTAQSDQKFAIVTEDRGTGSGFWPMRA